MVGKQRNSTRDELLDAGVRLFRMVPEAFLKSLSVVTVAEEAGFHRQTFYRYWDTQAEYVNELICRLMSTDSAPAADGMEVLPSRRSGRQDPARLMEDVARYDFDRVVDDPAVMMRIGLVALHALEDDGMAAMSRAYHESTIDRLADAFASLLEGWGRECVPPFTVRELAQIQLALLVGFVLQAKASGDDWSTAELFRGSLVQMLMGHTRDSSASDSI